MTKTMTRAQFRLAIAEKRGYGADYLGSMDAAIPLLRELPDARLEYVGDTFFFLTFKSKGAGMVEFSEGRVGKEAEAISLAWWEFRTGEVVELIEE